MYNVIVACTLNEWNLYCHFIEKQEYMGNICVIGIYNLSQEHIYKKIDGYECVQPVECYFDYIVATGKCMPSLKNDISIDAQQVINMEVFKLPGFDFIKYVHVLEKRISIISNTCWGGLTYHSLRMPFYSPFINMFLQDEDYMNLLENFDHVIEKKLEFQEMKYDVNIKRDYPVCRLGDVKIHMNHYTSFDCAKECWERRLSRLNKDYLFIEEKCESYEMAERFAALKFQHKIAFSPEDYMFDCVMPVKEFRNRGVNDKMKNKFWKIITDMTKWESSDYVYYDLLELLDNDNFVWRGEY